MTGQSIPGPTPLFLALPAEIRTTIYKSLFLGSRTRLTSEKTRDLRESHHPILLTCRQCHAEARHLYYSLNIWSFDSDNTLSDLFSDFFGPSRPVNIAPRVKHLHVTDQHRFRRACAYLTVSHHSLRIFPSLETFSGQIDIFVPGQQHAGEVKELKDEEVRLWVLNNINSGIWDPYHVAGTIGQGTGLIVLLGVRVVFPNAATGHVPGPRILNPFTREKIPLRAHTDVVLNITTLKIIHAEDEPEVFRVFHDGSFRVFRDDLSILRTTGSFRVFRNDLLTRNEAIHPGDRLNVFRVFRADLCGIKVKPSV